MIEVEFEESKKKLYLTPVDPGRKRLYAAEKVYCYLSTKYRLLYLGKPALEAMEMNKAWFKLSYDSGNQIIAWKVRHQLSNENLQEQGWKYCEYDKSGKANIGIGRILDTMPGLKAETYKNLEIKKYRDKGVMVDGNDTNLWYFIQIEDLSEPKKVDDDGNEI